MHSEDYMHSENQAFRIGERVVYAMHGSGTMESLIRQTVEGRHRLFYQVVFAKTRGKVLVAVDQAQEQGLRASMRTEEVPQVLCLLQQQVPHAPQHSRLENVYQWCKQRLRQGGVQGLAETQRFLFDLELPESFSNVPMRRLRAYVSAQLAAEIALAVPCSLAAAKKLIQTACTSKHPVKLLPSPSLHRSA